jgi:hypothetical protein
LALGAFAALFMAGLGLFWWQGRAEVERAAPPPIARPPVAEGLPQSDPGDMVGPAPPMASEITREQQRFFRLDRDRDGRITRNEMMSTRTDGFRDLDRDGNNLLTFEEWAVITANRFKAADRDGNLELSPDEFATTKPKPVKKPACRC